MKQSGVLALATRTVCASRASSPVRIAHSKPAKGVRFLVLLTSFTTTVMSEPLPSYTVRFCSEPICTDGRLDQAAWASAPWSSDFVWIDAGDPAPLRSRFKALYNRDGLHFAFEY